MIIAEAGINHNGKLSLAKKLVNASIYAGADAVKFQTFKENELPYKNISYEETTELKEYCDSRSITFLSTPHSYSAIEFLDKLVPLYKVASSFLTDRNFIEKVVSKGKPIILSTGSLKHKSGMSTLKEIETTLSWIPDANVTLMHCISKYPCHTIELNRFRQLQRFGKVVGMSDHTKRIRLGVRCPVVEKHIMLPNVDCVDKHVSIKPDEFRMMVDYIRGEL